VIPSVHEKIENGRLTDPATLDFLVAGVRDLLAEIGRTSMAEAA